MSNLQATIEKAASAFARSIIAAVKGSTLRELLAIQGSTEGAAAPKRRGRPPKAKPGRKQGRPPKVTTKVKTTVKKPTKRVSKKAAKKTAPKAGKKAAKTVAKTSANKKRSINYPKCSVPGCGKNRYAKGNGMCGEHFKASKAG